MALVKYSRLSVQPVTAAQWKLVCKMGGVTGCNLSVAATFRAHCRSSLSAKLA